MSRRSRWKEVADYFAQKLEIQVRTLERRIREDGERYFAEAERLAEKYAGFADLVQRAANPNQVLPKLSAVRALLHRGEIVKADKALERIRAAGGFVDQSLQYPLLETGSRVRSGGQRAAAARHGSPADREQKARAIRRAYRQARATGLSKGDSERKVARDFGISTRTVRNKKGPE